MKRTKRLLVMAAASPAVLLVGLGLSAASALAAGPYTCFPTCAEDDARFMVIPCNGLQTLAQNDLFFEFVIPSGADYLEGGIFDGDTGETDNGGPNWDLRSQPLEYTVYADPVGDGTGTQVLRRFSGDGNPFSMGTGGWPVDNAGMPLPNNDWFTFIIDDPTELLAAKGANGNYYFRMQVVLPNLLTGTSSAFKVRTNGVVTMDAEKPFAFEASLRQLSDAYIVYPDLVNWNGADPIEPYLSPTTYDGTFDFHMYLPAPAAALAVWDGDLDYGSFDFADNDTDDPDTPAAPLPAWSTPSVVPEGIAVGLMGATGDPWDDSMFVTFRRSPSVVYEVETPEGVIYGNMNPSGNLEWEQFKVTTDFAATRADADYGPGFIGDDGSAGPSSPLPKGVYHVHVSGMDLSNLNAWWFPYEVIGVCEDGDPPARGNLDLVVNAQAHGGGPSFPSCNARPACNQGVGNGPEDCDPGNSNQGDPSNSNDETGGTPGNPGKRGGSS